MLARFGLYFEAADCVFVFQNLAAWYCVCGVETKIVFGDWITFDAEKRSLANYMPDTQVISFPGPPAAADWHSKD